ncbi:thioesterase family protein [Mycobacterium parascrofulaceum ATCC BAA-614]|uniref:Thioesterase family protein n=1 Tax=Mycobacterium parascrofulaceum ATCC BAA-614 TaxID=525368 RepID=D5P742_9MYCO|nr:MULTISPECIES: PaaI family thioesterase [Mycobacterium]EFG78070.1 thioesterase family protein [Mycobacterium parascrofulaceum ATCC BAA-614]OCB27965.1 thioesterase [Mycobacterium malmoense]
MSQETGALDAIFEVLDAEEAQRVTARYAPLADAVRELIDATIHTAADDDVVADARTAIEAVTKSLRQRTRPIGVSYRVDGARPLTLGNAAIGLGNPIAPPLIIHHDGGGRCWSEFVLGSAYEGPPKLVHGGVSALVLDHMLGEAASEGLSKARFTGTITVKYLRGTPLGPLRCEAWVDGKEGRKVFARGTISDAAGVTVEAEGVFIEPAWAREAE